MVFAQVAKPKNIVKFQLGGHLQGHLGGHFRAKKDPFRPL